MNKEKIAVDEYPVKCLKLGSSFGRHFIIKVIPSQRRGKIVLLDRHELSIHSYEFREDGINAIIEFLGFLTKGGGRG